MMDELFRKTKVKAGMKGAIANPPSEYGNATVPDISLTEVKADAALDFALLFVKDKAELDQHFPAVAIDPSLRLLSIAPSQSFAFVTQILWVVKE